MKKVFIGLLIVAAGAAAFFFLRKKQTTITSNNLQKEWIIGKWKLDSIHLSKDSNDKSIPGIIGIIAPDLMKYRYEFKPGGSVVLVDSLTKDSSNYDWNKKDQLIWKEHPADTSGEIFNVSIPHKDSLLLQSTDSVVLLFTKLKE
ncbi:MAG TPA: hypothetical protein VJU78_18920 [Chitinophagaceae bacterium]|nr:hypothetical protein [Chitinophagaceae bacterium]